MMRRIREIIYFVIVSVFFLFLVWFYYEKPRDIRILQEEVLPVPPRMEYGIRVDTLMVFRDKIGRNQFLSDILLPFGVDYSRIDLIARKSREVFDVRRLRAGNWYTIITTRDSSARPLYFIYDISPVEFVVYPLKDTLSIYRGKKTVETKIAYVGGEISSSLWNAMVEKGYDPNLANELSEIYAWTIDFFGVQKGDKFKAIVNEQYVEGEYIGIGKIEAAWFQHAGHDLFALYFVQDSVGDYFDTAGGSMRRTFLKAPLRYSRISSGYSHSRLHPVLKIRRPHLGVDYAAPYGTPVHAVGDGVVTSVSWTSQGGRTVHIKHNGTYSTAYLHLSAYGKGISKGAYVKQGQVVGYVGSSGLATGPHLDFRFYRNGQPVDPLKVKSPPAEPVKTAYLEQFEQVKDSLVRVLQDSIQ